MSWVYQWGVFLGEHRWLYLTFKSSWVIYNSTDEVESIYTFGYYWEIFNNFKFLLVVALLGWIIFLLFSLLFSFFFFLLFSIFFSPGVAGLLTWCDGFLPSSFFYSSHKIHFSLCSRDWDCLPSPCVVSSAVLAWSLWTALPCFFSWNDHILPWVLEVLLVLAPWIDSCFHFLEESCYFALSSFCDVLCTSIDLADSFSFSGDLLTELLWKAQAAVPHLEESSASFPCSWELCNWNCPQLGFLPMHCPSFFLHSSKVSYHEFPLFLFLLLW